MSPLRNDGAAPRGAPDRIRLIRGSLLFIVLGVWVSFAYRAFGDRLPPDSVEEFKQALKQEVLASDEPAASTPEPAPKRKAPARRTPKHPLIIIAQSPDKTAAEAGLTRWKEKHPEAATHLAEDDILIDRMRGSATIWYRIRVNLRNVPEVDRPTQQTPDPDEDPPRAWREGLKS